MRKLLSAGLLGLSLFGCGTDDEPEGPDDPGGDSMADLSPGCEGDNASPGSSDLTLSFGGATRQYTLHVPAGYAGEPSALVLSMHGFMSNYEEQQVLSGFSELADSEGFVVAYPNGGGGAMLSWNAGDCCEYTETDRDDVGFISALIDEIGSTICIDRKKVYATGYSNGGFLSHRIACELSDKVAAIATVAGVLGIPEDSCDPSRPMPVLQLHGTADLVVPYPGGTPAGWEMTFPNVPPPQFRSAEVTRDFWADKNGCTMEPSAGFTMGDVACEVHAGCEGGARVELCTVDMGGHTWPSGDHSTIGGPAHDAIAAFFGQVSTSIDASQHMWDFLKAHSLP